MMQDGFLAGSETMSLADILMAPTLMRLAANLPVVREYDFRARLAPWFDAMERDPTYAKVRGSEPSAARLASVGVGVPEPHGN